MEDRFSKKQLIGFFIQEFDERSNLIVNAILDIDNAHDSTAQLKTILREIHGLKGSSKMVGLTHIADLVHKWEDLFKDISNGKSNFNDEVLNISLLIIDSIGEDTKEQFEKGTEGKEFPEILNELLVLRKGKEKSPAIKETSVDTVHEDIKKSTEELTNISVPLKKINALIDSLGQVIIKDNFLVNLEKRIEFFIDHVLVKKSREEILCDIKETLNTLHKEVQGNKYFVQNLKQEILSLKMIPVKNLTEKFPRMVYDISRGLGKKVNFKIYGDDTEIEVEVFNKLLDPIIHLIRNAIDHGIESPQERPSLEKNEIGSIDLKFEQTSDYFIVRIKDDGRGLSQEKIRKKIVETGLLSEKEVKDLGDDDLYRFIFNMGFTTKENADEISGRGIGMDVVKKIIIDDMKGKIEIDNKPGASLEFILFIPITLSILKVLLFISTNQLYCFPIDFIKGIFEIRQMPVKNIKKRNYVEFNNMLVPLYSFSDIIGTPCNSAEKYIVIAEYDFFKFAFAVEGILEQFESVQKKINPPLNRSPVYQGVVILGDGRLTPVINPNYFMNIRSDLQNSGKRSYAQKENLLERVLIVEDSPTTRAIEKSLLKELGYQVDAAFNGEDGLKKIFSNDYDLVISDVQMPIMSGIELLNSIRKRKKYKNLPFVFVSTVDEKLLGVDKKLYQGYIKKRDFTLVKIKELLEGILNYEDIDSR